MSRTGYLLLRRGGGVWALPEDAVASVRAGRGGVTVATRHGEIAADEVLAVDRGLAVRRPGALVGRLWPERCAGLAVHAGAPVVVIDPAAPPPALRRKGALRHDE